jgi:hypothetical protein
MSDPRRRDWVRGAQRDLVAKDGAPPGPEDEEEDNKAAGDASRSAPGERQAVHLVFVYRDGVDFSMPYALLPSVWSGPGSSFLIEYPQFTVWLRGRHLDELKEGVRRHKVSMVREFDVLQAEALLMAVTRIEIVEWFPSREVLKLGRVTGQWPMDAGSRGGRTPFPARAEDVEA